MIQRLKSLVKKTVFIALLTVSLSTTLPNTTTAEDGAEAVCCQEVPDFDATDNTN